MTNRRGRKGKGLTAKEYLTQAIAIEKLIASKKRLLARLRLKCSALSAPCCGDKVRGSRADSMGVVDKIIDLEAEIIAQESQLIDRQKEILDRIQLVGNPVLIAVLTDKYINGMSIEKIAEAMGRSERTICVWHGQALQIFRRETGMK